MTKRNKFNVSLTDKFIHNGHKFRSGLEIRHYKQFLLNPNIEVVEFEPYFLLMESFKYYDLEKDKTRSYGKFSYKADFLLKIKGVDRLVVWESKGMITEASQIRRKIWYNIYGDKYYYITSKSLKHCKKVLSEIINKKERVEIETYE